MRDTWRDAPCSRKLDNHPPYDRPMEITRLRTDKCTNVTTRADSVPSTSAHTTPAARSKPPNQQARDDPVRVRSDVLTEHNDRPSQVQSTHRRPASPQGTAQTGGVGCAPEPPDTARRPRARRAYDPTVAVAAKEIAGIEEGAHRFEMRFQSLGVTNTRSVRLGPLIPWHRVRSAPSGPSLQRCRFGVAALKRSAEPIGVTFAIGTSASGKA